MSKWKLYWVSSNGWEDCFVVAKNSRSAKRVEKDMNGFEDDDLEVTRVKDIPDKYEKMANKKFIDWSIKNNCNTHLNVEELQAWPYYAEDWLLKKLGAEFRYIDDQKEVLIDDIVYAPNKVYPVGLKSMKELYELTGDEILDITNVTYEGIDETIENILGECLIIIHRIEDYITNSFIFAVGNEKYSEYSIKELTKHWKEKFTFGKLIGLMKERFNIKPDVENSLQLFLHQRNKIAHGITKDERFDIDSLWGKKELVGFLALFIQNAHILEPIIQSAYIASMSLSYYLMEQNPSLCSKKIKREIKEFHSDPFVKYELEIFQEFFELKKDSK